MDKPVSNSLKAVEQNKRCPCHCLRSWRNSHPGDMMEKLEAHCRHLGRLSPNTSQPSSVAHLLLWARVTGEKFPRKNTAGIKKPQAAFCPRWLFTQKSSSWFNIQVLLTSYIFSPELEIKCHLPGSNLISHLNKPSHLPQNDTQEKRMKCTWEIWV